MSGPPVSTPAGSFVRSGHSPSNPPPEAPGGAPDRPVATPLCDLLYEPYNGRMPLSVGDLLKTPGLPLRTVAGERGLNHAIRWVHVSELDDPTPWLKGGELLLTTGMALGKAPSRQRAYLNRLVTSGLAGLGFGLGFSFQRVPKAVLDAAEAGGFPVFEVPYDVPFIAITEAVFTRLVAEQYDLLSRSLDAEHSLTRAVLEGQGTEGVISALTRVVGGWAVLIDLHGGAISTVPPSARTSTRRIWTELQSSRPEGIHFSLSLVDRGQNIAIQPVSSQGRIEAYLAVGKKEALTQFDSIVSSHALGLLAIELSKVRAVSEAERRLRGDALEQILAETLTPAKARRTLERLGFDLSLPVGAIACASTDPVEHLAELCEEALSRGPHPFLSSARDDHVLVVAQPDGAAGGFLSDFRERLAGRSTGVVMAGAGSLVPFTELAQGVREARYALQVCHTEKRTQAEFSDLGTYQLLLSLQEPEALKTFAASVLGPLDEYDEAHGGHLLPSLRAFLERNARWEAAAAELYVHRHTLRYRMRKVEELTGRDLTSARDRMELFLALRARDLLASSEWPGEGWPALAPSYKARASVSPPGSRRARQKG
jgi:PucR family transcriptional regulator, purine catabolism regulatory protein